MSQTFQYINETYAHVSPTFSDTIRNPTQLQGFLSIQCCHYRYGIRLNLDQSQEFVL